MDTEYAHWMIVKLKMIAESRRGIREAKRLGNEADAASHRAEYLSNLDSFSRLVLVIIKQYDGEPR